MFHIPQFLLVDSQIFSEQLGGGYDPLRLQLPFFLVQIHKNLSPDVGSPDFDHSGIVQEKLEDICFYPPCGISRETCAPEWIETLDCLDQPEIPFLNEVQQIAVDLVIDHRDLHYKLKI